MMMVVLLTLMIFPIHRQGAILHTILNSGLLPNLDLFKVMFTFCHGLLPDRWRTPFESLDMLWLLTIQMS